MLTNDEEKFWGNFKLENVRPIEQLIKNNYDVAAVKLICSAIDALAGFFIGRTTKAKVGKSFEEFLKKYMPVFFKYDLGELAFRKDNKSVESPAIILYVCYRNGLIHDGSFGLGVEIYRDPDYKVLYNASGIKIMRLNVIGFFEYFKKAINEYEEDLKRDNDIYIKFQEKYLYINQPVFVLKQA